MTISNAILIATNIPIVGVAIYAAYRFKYFTPKLKTFSLYLFLSALVQLPSLALYLYEQNNMPFLHVYTLLGGTLLILFYRQVLHEYLPQAILNSVAVLFFCFIIIDTLFFEPIHTFNTFGLIVQSIIIIILALSTFSLHLHVKKKEKELHGSTINWINSGFFIYFSSNLILYYFGAYFARISIDFALFRNIWVLHSLFTVTMYVFFFIGLWKHPKH